MSVDRRQEINMLLEAVIKLSAGCGEKKGTFNVLESALKSEITIHVTPLSSWLP
jgi:hypothetical protein